MPSDAPRNTNTKTTCIHVPPGSGDQYHQVDEADQGGGLSEDPDHVHEPVVAREPAGHAWSVPPASDSSCAPCRSRRTPRLISRGVLAYVGSRPAGAGPERR